MATGRTLDREHGEKGTDAANLVESAGEVALVEAGPDSTSPRLAAGAA